MENISHKRELLRGLGYRVQVESGSRGGGGDPEVSISEGTLNRKVSERCLSWRLRI